MPISLCRCCFISVLPPRASHTEHPVQLCTACITHYGNPAKIERDHEKMMAALREANASAMERSESRRLAAERDLAAAREQLASLTATVVSELSERPKGEAKVMVDDALVMAAERRAETAAKSRDLAFAAVFRMIELHHEVGEQCSCGKRVTQCDEFALLGFIRPRYHDWEKQQIARLRQGKPHGLPLDHPQGREFSGREWEWKGIRSTRA